MILVVVADASGEPGLAPSGFRQRFHAAPGFRPATPDNLPLVGAWDPVPGLWIAAGHEGLGVTTAPGTARLLVDALLGRASEIDRRPYSPARAFPQDGEAHA